jgi:hypothetical protein
MACDKQSHTFKHFLEIHTLLCHSAIVRAKKISLSISEKKSNSPGRLLSFFLLIAASFLYLWPFLLHPAFNVIDDGASLRASRDLLNDVSHGTLQHWPGILIEVQDGRLRPVYHLFYFTIYAIFGANPIFFWIGQAVLLGFTLVFCSIFIFLVTKNRWLATLSPFALLAFAPTAENFYRLGTAEPKQMMIWPLFMIWCWWVAKVGWKIKTMLVGIFVLWMCLLTKETSITFVAVFWMFWVWQVLFARHQNAQEKMQTVLYGLAIGLFASCYFFLLPARTGYNTAFQFQVHDMWLRLLSSRKSQAVLYVSFVMASLSVPVRWIFEWRALLSKKGTHVLPSHNHFVWQCLLVVQAVLLLVIGILPWQWTLSRYFYPLYVADILLVALEIAAWMDILAKIKKRFFWWRFLLSNLGIAVAIFIQRYLPNSAKGLSFQRHDIKLRLLINRLDMAEVWLPLALAAFACGFRFVIKMYRREKIDWREFFWFGWLLVAIELTLVFSSLIWLQLDFNAYIVLTALIVTFICAETCQWWKWFATERFSLFFFAPMLLLFVAAGTILHRYVFQNWWGDPVRYFHSDFDEMKTSFDTYQISYGAIRYLLTDIQPNTHIYVFENEYEIIFEFGLYASQFRQRPIELHTNSGQLVVDFQKDYPYLRYSAEPITDYVKDQNKKVLMIRPMWWQPIATSSAIASISGQVRPLPPALTFHTFPDKVFWQAVEEK